MWENREKIEKQNFAKSRDFIRCFILRLKYCHMIIWLLASIITTINDNDNHLPSSAHYYHPINSNNNDSCKDPNIQQHRQ